MNALKATTNVSYSRTFGVIVGWAAMLASVPAYALSLGGFQVTSALDEPLRAEIQLESVDAETLETLKVSLGSSQDFQRADVPRSEFLQQLQFSVTRQGDDAVVVVTTEQPVKEPFLHFLVSAEWSGGKLVREYTGLLDPPMYADESPASVDAPEVAETQPSEPQPAATGAETADTASSPSVTVGSAGGTAEYGPTREGDTLWDIASRLDTGSMQVSVFQVMIALQRQNPDAFIDNNVNRLRTGQTLRLRNLSSIAEIGREEASAAYTAQLEEWRSSGARVADAGEEVSAPAETASAADAAAGEPAAAEEAPAGDEAAAGDETATETAAAETAADTAASEQAAGAEDEVLRIVQAEVDRAEQSESASAGPDRSGEMAEMRSRIATLEESLESRNLENEELRERVRLLESQLENAQRLIEIESQELAAAQQQAAERQAAAEAEAENQASAQQLTTQPVEPAGEQASQGGADQGSGDTSTPQEAQQAPQGDSQTDTAAQTSQADAAPETQTAQQQASTAATTAANGSQASDAGQANASQDAAGSGQANASQGSSQTGQASGQQTGAQSDQGGSQGSENVRTVSSQASQGGAWWSQMPDMLFSSWMWMVGAGVGVLVLVLGLLMFLRRRQSIAEFEESILSGSALDSYSETSDSAATSASDTSFLSDFGTAGMGTMQADEVDPLAEAEVYLAYGRDEQAEDVLKEAARRDPERAEIKLKLLEIYKQRNDVKSFETIAEELYPAGDQGDVEIWRQVSDMGRDLSPGNPLFQEAAPGGETQTADAASGGDAEAAPGAGASAMDFDFDELSRDQAAGPEAPSMGDAAAGDDRKAREPALSAAAQAPVEPARQADDSSLDFGDDFLQQASSSVDPSMQPFPKPDEQTDLDRELDRLAGEREAPAGGNGGGEPGAAGGDGEEFPSREVSWDTADTDEAALEFPGGGTSGAGGDGEATLDFSADDTSEIEFDLNLDESSIQRISGSEAADTSGSTGDAQQYAADDDEGVLEFESENIPPQETWAGPSSDASPVRGDDETVDYSPTDDVAAAGAPGYNEADTKLDLARAYLDMGDKVGARSIIDEVMREGDPAQRDQAAELASQL